MEIDDLGSWPSARARDLVERLVAGGPSWADAMRELLRGAEPAVRAAACVTLSRIGNWRDYEAIRRQLFDPHMGRFTHDLLEALDRLDPQTTLRLALVLLPSVGGPSGRAVARFLESRLRPEDLDDVRALLDHSSVRVRRIAFQILREVRDPSLAARALDLLGDRDERLARDAAELLRQSVAPDLVAPLRELARGPLDQLFCHAILLLSFYENCGMRDALPDDQAVRMARNADSSDPFLRAACCVGMMSLGYCEGRGVTTGDLKERVIPSIMELFSSGVLFDGFWTVLPVASLAVENLTGWRLGSDLTEWRRVWKEHGESFPIMQEIDTYDPLSAPNASVTWSGRAQESNRRARTLRFVTPLRIDATVPRGTVRLVLLPERMARLIDDLIAAGLLDPQRPRIAPGGQAGESRRISTLRLVVPGHCREVALEGPAGGLFERIVEKVARQNDWQLYRPPDEPFASFWKREMAWWSDSRTEEERAGRIVRLVTKALPGLDPALVPGALDRLEEVLDDGARLEPLRVTELIAFALAAPRLDDSVRRAVRLATRVGDPLLFRPLALALLKSYGRLSDPLVSEVMQGLEQVATSMTDSDPRLRRLAAASAASLGAAAVSLLAELADDPDRSVRLQAIESLGEIGGEAAMDLLVRRAQSGAGDGQCAAIKALGRVGGERGLDVLVAATQSARLDVAVEAIDALSRIGGERAVRVLASRLVSEGPESLVGARAAEGLRRIGGEPVRERLAALLESPREDLRREAAFSLGEMGVDEVAPRLLDLLEDEQSAQRSRSALTLLTQQNYGRESWKYRALAGSGVTFVDSFRLALGSPESLDPADLRGPERNLQRALPVLLESIGDDRWWVRQAACVLLRELCEQPGPAPARNASPAERAEVRESWKAIAAAAGGAREPESGSER